MASILEELQKKYPYRLSNARNIAEAVALIYETDGGSGAIADAINAYVTITFDPNGGEGVPFDMRAVKLADGVMLPACPFTPPSGKYFDYWFNNTNGTTKENLKYRPNTPNRIGLGADLTFYAIWANLVTISFNANGGEGEIDDILVPDGQSIETLPDGSGLTAPEGKVFGGWATTDSALVADVTAPYTPADDATLYAFWEAEGN